MSLTAISWLPPAGTHDIESALARVVGDWLSEWIASRPPLKTTKRPKGEARTMQWRGIPGAMVGVGSGMEAQLGLAVCDQRAAKENPSDSQLLGLVGNEMLDRLEEFLAGIGGQKAASSHAPSVATVGDDELFVLNPPSAEWSLGFRLSADLLIALRRMAAGVSARPVLGNRKVALGEELAALGCHLGQARLTAGEVASLSAGDLIVLDRKTSDALPLTIECNSPTAGRVKIVKEGDGAKATIVERANLLRKAG